MPSTYKDDFIRFLIQAGVLRFGEFVTKSGRKTPYFFNLGNICDGFGIERLADFYAHALMAELGGDFNCLYGPAYKGVPLAVATAGALHRLYGKNVYFTFNRKEAKDHGEKGVTIGHTFGVGDRVVIVEDVITAGTSIDESIPLIKQSGDIPIAAVVVAVDRQERGTGSRSALDDIRDRYGVKAFGIVRLEEIVIYLTSREVDGKLIIDPPLKSRIDDYLRQYRGV